MIKDILHLKAPGNWINDANGFIYYQGKYHLFYQHFPYAPVWGTMHWGHAVSDDLVHWEHKEVALFPTKDYDRNGVFSGSAIEKDGMLYLYYSAVRYLKEDPENIHLCPGETFETSQAMMISPDGYQFDNWGDKRQIIPVSTDMAIADAVHTRDPKVWKSGDTYYMILGSTFEGKYGRVLFYKSRDAGTWTYVNPCRDEAFGKILECPDIFKAGEGYVFIGSPMGILEDGLEYAHQSICVPVDFEEESCELELLQPSQFVDYGLDLYAPQTTLDKDGRRVMIAWMRMPYAVDAPDRNPWRGMMCLPRVVEEEAGHIYFRVHPETEQYFSKVVLQREEIDYQKPFRIKTVLKEGDMLDIGGYCIKAENDCIHTDRRRVFARKDYGRDTKEAEQYRMTSSTPPLCGRYELDIFAEPNLIEVFVNQGQYVVSNVVYGLERGISGPVEQLFQAETGRE